MRSGLVGLCAAATLCASSIAAFGQEVVFEDRFEGALQPGWVWLRENPACRRFVNNSLEILTEPLFAAGEARNALVRPLNFWRWQNGRATGSYRIETECYFLEEPTRQYQQCGVYWMRNNKPLFKLVFAKVDDSVCVFPGKTPVKTRGGRLRLTVSGQNIVAEFCPLGETTFQRVYEGRIDSRPTDRISLQCWGGAREAGADVNASSDWARFRYFRVETIED